ncbi:hypothetical protein KZX46_07890 [Polymorphobacter sp. PAMC 29334]|uniref:hypothetical protein n=1 Tax=Polymorphobacter sp. PAMC 29334 TaxID=2862331 RepID=UPI001C793A5D|nr:hypothetical protein [Polymorphobacter sp. PAMC 29334]QYE35859.1 hypothetical protein KZX46_07890 [Polymorphobacter sp. PAMC 29334]
MGYKTSLSIRACALILVTVQLSSPASAGNEIRWFSVLGQTEFSDVRSQLQVLTNELGHAQKNRFCVVGQVVGRDRQAYVQWLTANKLILWEPQESNPRAIAGSRRYLDLDRDVVAGNDVDGSTYQLTRATANRIVRACRKFGNTFTVERRIDG